MFSPNPSIFSALIPLRKSSRNISFIKTNKKLNREQTDYLLAIYEEEWHCRLTKTQSTNVQKIPYLTIDWLYYYVVFSWSAGSSLPGHLWWCSWLCVRDIAPRPLATSRKNTGPSIAKMKRPSFIVQPLSTPKSWLQSMFGASSVSWLWRMMRRNMSSNTRLRPVPSAAPSGTEWLVSTFTGKRMDYLYTADSTNGPHTARRTMWRVSIKKWTYMTVLLLSTIQSP